MKNKLIGKVALVTGAGRGTGALIAHQLAATGAIVAANDISPMNVEAVVNEINASGGKAQAFVQDMAKKMAIQALVIDVTDAYERIDILVNCANVEPKVGLLEMDEWDVHRVFDVNAVGAMLLMQSVGRVMKEQGGGIMFNVLRLSGREQETNRAVYAASRFGLAGLIKFAATELIQHNIKVYGLTSGLPEMALSHFENAAAGVLALSEKADASSGSLFEVGD